jgi:uncharacterized repeat protein (TIGR03806 family)
MTALTLATLCAALGAGLMAGVFFAFSSFVMPALRHLPAAQGVAAMQAINVFVLNPWFLSVFVGTGVLSAGLAVAALFGWSAPGAAYRLAGSLLYVVGTLLVTAAYHVPRNQALAELSPMSPAAETAWLRYAADWTRWNHLRAGAALAAAALLTLALLRSRLPFTQLLGVLLVVLSLSGCTSEQLQPIAPPAGGTPVERVSQLGIFEGDPKQQLARADFVAYEVNAPLYADGASKRRFVYVPPGTKAHVSADRWQLPVGSYLVKTFSLPVDARNPKLGERLIETRFLVKTSDGFRAATYVWNSDQTDAIASSGDVDLPVSWIDAAGQKHARTVHVPDSAECNACHSGRALAFRSRQLDRAGSYADGTHDQISHLVAAGVVDGPPPAHARLSDPFGDAPLDERARSYLDANCSHCHGQGGIAEPTKLLWDFEHTDAPHLAVCRDTAEVDGRDRVIVPGHPEASEFLARMLTTDPFVHMPRGPTRSIDPRGVELLSSWVAAMPSRRCL